MSTDQMSFKNVLLSQGDKHKIMKQTTDFDTEFNVVNIGFFQVKAQQN